MNSILILILTILLFNLSIYLKFETIANKLNFKNTPINEKNCFLIISKTLIINFFPFVPNGNFFNNWISITNFYYIGIYLYSYKRIFS